MGQHGKDLHKGPEADRIANIETTEVERVDNEWRGEADLPEHGRDNQAERGNALDDGGSIGHLASVQDANRTGNQETVELLHDLHRVLQQLRERQGRPVQAGEQGVVQGHPKGTQNGHLVLPDQTHAKTGQVQAPSDRLPEEAKDRSPWLQPPHQGYTKLPRGGREDQPGLRELETHA